MPRIFEYNRPHHREEDSAMKLEKNVGKKEGAFRILLGIAMLILMVWTYGWIRWIAGLAGVSLILTGLAGR
ncbi:MAG: DUF2892 domain-containing protein [Pseudomonadota bacterium]